MGKPQVDFLQAHGYTCVTFDNRGCGRSGQPRYRYTTQMMARDALELVSVELGWTLCETHLVAISMGGMIALEMLASLAEGRFADIVSKEDRFLSASLLVTQGVGWRNPQLGMPPLAYWRIMASAVFPRGLSARARMYRGLEQAFSREWLRADSGQTHPQTGIPLTNGHVLARRGAKLWYAKKAEGVSPTNSFAGYLGQVAALATHSVAPARLTRLAQQLNNACPVLVVCAGRDNLVKYEAQRSLACALLPAVTEMLDLPNGSHAVNEEHVDEFHSALLRVLFSASRWQARVVGVSDEGSTSTMPRSRL